ncbi:T9SS type A sorting domain-containing protein [Flavobacterium litorale]|uniref:DUF4397 domain-containing protein n=1 Tax=Flavobacterium litorale TaxID=2856519 RepID=A0ABX8V4G5_9FLAO|nr:DUF4397 domain-containing protein [Flavobacterium litorale]QYJ67685.1 DUF4397 domain-containing protein [Flavobacterium litorale]
MKNFTNVFMVLLSLFSVAAVAQTARVQVIHNSADLAAEVVDVYLDDNILIDNFEFRTASGFVDIDAGVEISIDVAPANSTSSAESLYNLTTTLMDGETYILVANGIVSDTGYMPDQLFELSVFAGARETAMGANQVDMLIHHGSTDAPTVDVVETSVPVGTILNNISYPSFDDAYLELIEDDYIIDITDESGANVVASYQVPLAELELAGSAITALASGFLDPSMNSNGPAFGIWVATAAGGPLLELPLATAKVQVIHNAADLGATPVDVYLDDEMLIDNFMFRTASAFVNVPADTPISIDVAGGGSASSADSIYNLTTTLEPGGTYIIVANGIVSDSGYSPDSAFELYVYDMGREMAMNGANTDVLVFHGATDAPIVDVTANGVGVLVDNIQYGEFEENYLELPTANYTLNVTTPDDNIVIAAYEANLADLSLDGAAITVLASGFLNPDVNSNGPAFGLWAATANGGALVELPQITTARVQVIHNAADLGAAVVDVYLDDNMLINNFEFRTASAFIDAPAGEAISIDVAGADSASSAESIYNLTTTLTPGQTYVLVANGIVSENGYSPSTPFEIYVYGMGRETATDGANTDVLVFHGATDAPMVDVTANGAGILVDDIEYGEFEDMYLELPTANYVLNVTTADGGSTVASYEANLADLSLNGAAITVLASGFLSPGDNSNGPGFGLWAATATGGGLVELTALPLSVTDFESDNFVIYPNPASSTLTINAPFADTVDYIIYDMSGRSVMSANTSGTIDVNGLQNGMYMLQLNANGVTSQQKIVIRK